MHLDKSKCPKCGGTSGGTCSACERADLHDGEHLPSSIRSRMESGFGTRLPDDVRLHTGPEAVSVADRARVRAFAIGHDVGFASGEYQPNTPEGDVLLAHELAHTLQASVRGAPAPESATEHDANRSAGSAIGRMFGVSNAPARPPGRAAALGLHGCPNGTGAPPGQGLTGGLAPGVDTKGYTLDKYIELWERHQGRTMTDEEKKRLAAGCVGVTRTNLGGDAATNQCYATFEQAKQRTDQLEKSSGVRPFIFSKRFWSMGKAFPSDAGGKVDMKNDSGAHPSGEVNFDYGWYDEKNDSWWHANHCDPVTGSAKCRQSYRDPTDPDYRMKVYQSTLEHYSDPNYFGADKQVFCVSYSKLN
jgi:Domain of unknown function (DUF4157)